MTLTQYLQSGTALFALTVGLTAAPHAWAQEVVRPPEPDAQASQIEDIVVTARRRDERLLDAPVAITAIGGETLSDYSVTRVADLATLVPSMVAGKAASGSSASIFLRGVGSTALSAGFDQSVSFVIDGLPMSRGREISLRQFDISGVEVLKGPQALFFGKNTTGGVISVTSNSPTDVFEAGGKIGYGFEADEKYAEAYVSGPISDTLSARLAGRYSDSEGAFTNTAAETYPTTNPGQFRTRNSDRRGGSETSGARLTLDWHPSEVFTASLKTGFSKVEDGGPTDLVERVCGSGRTTPLPTNGLPASPNTDCVVDGRADSSALPVETTQNYRWARDGKLYADFASEYAILNTTLTVGQFDINSITGYTHFLQEDLNNVTGEGYPASFSQRAEFTQYSQELRAESNFDGPFNVMFGAFYAKGDFRFDTDAYIFPVPLDPVRNTYVSFSRDDGFESESWSVFAQGTYNLTDQFELSGGARYSHEMRDSYQRSRDVHSAFAAVFPGGVVLNDRYEDDNVSPEVTLRYKPSTDTTLYASYKQGFKGGGFNLSQGLSPGASVDAGRYGAETAEGVEVGYRSLLLDRHLRFSITAYRYVYSDLQVQFFDPSANSLISGNAGELRTQGVEADFNLNMPTVEGLSFRGAASYSDAVYENYVGQCYPGQTIAEGCDILFSDGRFNNQDYAGKTPPKAPEFAARLGGAYEVRLPSDMQLRVSSDVSYTSSYNYTDALRPDAIQKAFTKVDAALTLVGPAERWTVSLIGRNLTDELVVAAANDIPFTGGTGTGTAGPGLLADMSAFIDNPREIILEASFKF